MGCLRRLMKYPPVEDVHLFVEFALQLMEHPTQRPLSRPKIITQRNRNPGGSALNNLISKGRKGNLDSDKDDVFTNREASSLFSFLAGTVPASTISDSNQHIVRSLRNLCNDMGSRIHNIVQHLENDLHALQSDVNTSTQSKSNTQDDSSQIEGSSHCTSANVQGLNQETLLQGLAELKQVRDILLGLISHDNCHWVVGRSREERAEFKKMNPFQEVSHTYTQRGDSFQDAKAPIEPLAESHTEDAYTPSLYPNINLPTPIPTPIPTPSVQVATNQNAKKERQKTPPRVPRDLLGNLADSDGSSSLFGKRSRPKDIQKGLFCDTESDALSAIFEQKKESGNAVKNENLLESSSKSTNRTSLFDTNSMSSDTTQHMSLFQTSANNTGLFGAENELFLKPKPKAQEKGKQSLFGD